MTQYTVETAYEAMVNGAKQESGDPVYDWLYKELNNTDQGWERRVKMMRYLRLKNFEQYIYDIEVFEKSKHVLIDTNNINENLDQEDWYEYAIIEVLFESSWYYQSRLVKIIDLVANLKKEIIEDTDREFY